MITIIIIAMLGSPQHLILYNELIELKPNYQLLNKQQQQRLVHQHCNDLHRTILRVLEATSVLYIVPISIVRYSMQVQYRIDLHHTVLRRSPSYGIPSTASASIVTISIVYDRRCKYSIVTISIVRYSKLQVQHCTDLHRVYDKRCK